VLAAVTFVAFGLIVASILTNTFAFDNRTEAWVGAALLGVGWLFLTAWAVVLRIDEPLEWAERAGGDLLLAGVGVGFVVAGLATFAGGVI
jgi:hypothetical protein